MCNDWDIILFIKSEARIKVGLVNKNIVLIIMIQNKKSICDF